MGWVMVKGHQLSVDARQEEMCRLEERMSEGMGRYEVTEGGGGCGMG